MTDTHEFYNQNVGKMVKITIKPALSGTHAGSKKLTFYAVISDCHKAFNNKYRYSLRYLHEPNAFERLVYEIHDKVWCKEWLEKGKTNNSQHFAAEFQC